MNRHVYHLVAFGIFLGLVPSVVGAFQQESFTTRIVTTGLQNPWEIAWGPDGHIWVTERVAMRVTRVNPADGAKSVAITISEVFQNHGQDGLLGMALHPDLLRSGANNYVYVAYTYDADPGPELGRRLKVRRYTYDPRAQTLANGVDVITGLPAGTDHVSGRLAFGPDQKLYLSVGDQGSNFLANYCNLNRAQELPSANDIRQKDWTLYQGKLLRLNPDGSIPADNPVFDGVRSHIYTYGHRNAQGLVFGSGGRLYSSEHGPNTDDEVNLVEAGKNYGWPYVAGFIDDKAYVYANWSRSAPEPCATLKFSPTAAPPPSVPQQKESAWSHPDYKKPLQTFFTVEQGSSTIAAGGLDIYTAKNGIPGWADSLLVLGMKKGLVYRLKLSSDGRSVDGDPKEIFKSTNRYRDIAINPDNRTIYISSDNEGSTTDASGRTVRTLENPGAILEFSFKGAPGR